MLDNANIMRSGRSTGLRNASIEIQGPDGNWTPYSNPDNAVDHAQSQARAGSSPLITSTVGNGSANTGLNVEEGPHGQRYDHFDVPGMGTQLQFDFSYTLGLQNLNEHVVGEEPMTLDVPQLSPPMLIGQHFPQYEQSSIADLDFDFFNSTNWTTRSPSPLFPPVYPEFYVQKTCNLDALPFKQFMKDLGASGG